MERFLAETQGRGERRAVIRYFIHTKKYLIAICDFIVLKRKTPYKNSAPLRLCEIKLGTY